MANVLENCPNIIILPTLVGLRQPTHDVGGNL